LTVLAGPAGCRKHLATACLVILELVSFAHC
jgi:hypothetical protein